MTLYLMSQYHVEMPTASNMLFYWSAANNFTPVLGAIVADSYVGRFYMSGFGSLVSLPMSQVAFRSYEDQMQQLMPFPLEFYAFTWKFPMILSTEGNLCFGGAFNFKIQL
ncbi:hypothetical protein ACH5RR_041192 [Cinchona calisaya]|uniref:Uncharacterized protein n=1 Tax=Cinchona calisaya TaxID=153742 RepID=A0ABD2XY96_9GENT